MLAVELVAGLQHLGTISLKINTHKIVETGAELGTVKVLNRVNVIVLV